MAKKQERESRLDYGEAIRKLRREGPKPLYFLWGPEDYLREDYLAKLRSLCLPEGEDSFSYKRLNGPTMDLNQLRDAVDAMPFLTERSFVELRDLDLGGLGEEEGKRFLKILSDIPEYCTVALVQGVQFTPDGRLKTIKTLRGMAEELKFTSQSLGKLSDWIVRRFAAAGKQIDLDTAQHLIFLCGDLMNRLIPEIEKIAAYARGPKVTTADVDAVADHIPEADVFTMTDYIAQRRYDSALSVLAELLADRRNDAFGIHALLSSQMRRLYAAAVILDRGGGVPELMDTLNLKEYPARLLLQAARRYTTEKLRRAVEICAETEYLAKSGGGDMNRLLPEAVLRIAAEKDRNDEKA